MSAHTSFPLEGDGLVENLFYYLWCKDDADQSPRINIPDTIVYKYRQPAFWYFTSSSGRIRKKTKFNLNNVKIEEIFTRRAAPHDIVAYYMCTGTDADGAESTTIEYFNPSTLHDFLYQREKINNGVLQRFIEPKGTSNSLIRAIYSPKICLVERRINIRKLSDHRFGMYERAVTYEGPEFHSHQAPVRGSLLPSHVQTQCETIVDHVSAVTFRKFIINRMVLQLKVDAADRLWLLWCSSCRVAPDPNVLRKRAVKTVPINIDSVIKLPKHVRLSTSAGQVINSNTSSTAKPFDCPSCGRRVDAQDQYETPYQAIIAHFEQLVALLSAEMEALGRTDIEWPPEPDIIKAAGGVGFGGSVAPPNGPVTEEEVVIPPVLRLLHPRLNVTDYKRYRKDPLFLYKYLHTCEECFLVYAQLLSCPVESLPSAVGVFGTGNFQGAADMDRTGNLLMRSLTTRQAGRGGRSPGQAWGAPATNATPMTGPPPGAIVLTGMGDSRLHPELPKRVDLGRVGSLAQEALVTSSSAAEILPGAHPTTAGYSTNASAMAEESGDDDRGFRDDDDDDDDEDEDEEGYDDEEEEEEPMEWQPPKVDPTPSLKEREEAFFQDLYHNPNLQAGHPLRHMISASAKLASAKATLANARSAPELVMERMAAGAATTMPTMTPGGTSMGGFGPLPPLGGLKQRTKTEASPYSRVQSLLGPSKRRVRKGVRTSTSPIRGQTASTLGSAGSPSPTRAATSKSGKSGKMSASAASHRNFLLDTLKDVRDQLGEADEVADSLPKGGRRRKSRQGAKGGGGKQQLSPQSKQRQEQQQPATPTDGPVEGEEGEEDTSVWLELGTALVDGLPSAVSVRAQGAANLLVSVKGSGEQSKEWSLSLGGDELYPVLGKRLREIREEEERLSAAQHLVEALRFVPPLSEIGPHTLCWDDPARPQPVKTMATRQRLHAAGRKDGPMSSLFSIWTEVGERYLIRANSKEFEHDASLAMTEDEVTAATGVVPSVVPASEWCPRLLSKVSLVRPGKEWILEVEGMSERTGPVRHLFQRRGEAGELLTAMVVQDRFHVQAEQPATGLAGSVELLGWTTAGMNTNQLILFVDRLLMAPFESLDSDQRECRLKLQRLMS